MRLVVHDYSGHPGQVHLSRELARRGHRVEHQFCSSYTTGRGATERRAADPETFTVRSIALKAEFARYSPAARLRQELQYAIQARRAIIEARPDAVVLSNIPLLSLFVLTLALRIRRLPYVFWQQDVYSDAIATIARERLRRLGAPVGWVANRCEQVAARGAGAVIAISETFIDRLTAWGVPPTRVHVIPNWAAIDEMPTRPRDNEWARSHGLVGVPVVMYAGTLGLKHDPSTLLELARAAPPGTRTVVVSQGIGREWLENRRGEAPGLMLLNYQPYEHLPDMLASADVLVVLLEGDASRYSVPSKVLNYLCAARPILAILPRGNAVAQMVEGSASGVVVDPGDVESASVTLNLLLADRSELNRLGDAARRYAERAFDVGAVAAQFESVLNGVLVYDANSDCGGPA